APARFLVERGTGADIETDVGDRNDRLPAARVARVVVPARPDGIVMVARIGRVDRDDRDVGQTLALAEIGTRRPLRLFQNRVREFVRYAVLVDGDQAEAARCERIAENGIHPGADPRRSTGLFRKHQVTRNGLAQVRQWQLAPLLLVDGLQPEILAFLMD